MLFKHLLPIECAFNDWRLNPCPERRSVCCGRFGKFHLRPLVLLILFCSCCTRMEILWKHLLQTRTCLNNSINKLLSANLMQILQHFLIKFVSVFAENFSAVISLATLSRISFWYSTTHTSLLSSLSAIKHNKEEEVSVYKFSEMSRQFCSKANPVSNWLIFDKTNLFKEK